MPTDDEEILELTRAGAAVDPASIKRATPKKIITAAFSAGFNVTAFDYETFEQGAVFKSGTRVGQRPAGKNVVHLAVGAKIPGAAIFEVRFRNYSFDHARVWDAAGWPTELYANYAIGANTLRQHKDETEKSWQARLTRSEETTRRQEDEYNDGQFYTNMAPRFVKTATAFDEWLADLVPGYTVRKKKVTEAPATVEVLLGGSDWNG